MSTKIVIHTEAHNPLIGDIVHLSFTSDIGNQEAARGFVTRTNHDGRAVAQFEYDFDDDELISVSPRVVWDGKLWTGVGGYRRG
jgi:hypothetical protein